MLGRSGRALTTSLRLAQVPAVVTAPESPSGREVIETEIIKSLILSYFNIVKKTVCDVVPKVCMNFMVNASKETLQKELVKELYKEELFNELLKEGEDVSERRAVVASTLKLLRGSLDILGQIRDHNVSGGSTTGGDLPTVSNVKTPSSAMNDQNSKTTSNLSSLTLY
jgi:dynamin 1-like protein